MYGYIYITTNLINGKQYIGQKKYSKYPNKHPTYLGSGILLTRAINKYGPENFSCRILQWCKSRWELNTREKAWILMYNAVKDPNFYNISRGGDGSNEEHRSKETKEKISRANLGRKLTEEHKKKLSLVHTGMKIYNRKKINLTENHKKNIGNSNIGKHEPEKHSYLNEEIVLRIVEEKKYKTLTQLSKEYNVPHTTISSILTGKSWSSVTGIIYKPCNRKSQEYKDKMKNRVYIEKQGRPKKTEE